MVETIGFVCPHCGERLQLSAALGGRAVNCPKCRASLSVPEGASGEPPPPNSRGAAIIYCKACGLPNLENNFRCTNCGAELHETVAAAVPIPVDDPLLAIIPYKNAPALWAYYLGVFSLIPCLGIFLGIAAIVMGIQGLGHAKKHPEAKGVAHAWAGIILGSLVLVGHACLIALPFVLKR